MKLGVLMVVAAVSVPVATRAEAMAGQAPPPPAVQDAQAPPPPAQPAPVQPSPSAQAEADAAAFPASATAAARAPRGPPSRFEGKLVLVLLDDRDHPSERGGRSLWGLQRPLVYQAGASRDLITVPAGFVTDLTSVPRFAWTLLPPDGPWTKAAVIHDFLYATQGTGVWKGHPSGNARPAAYTRAEADGILREAMADRGVDVTRRNIIWAAVRVGGGGGWGH